MKKDYETKKKERKSKKDKHKFFDDSSSNSDVSEEICNSSDPESFTEKFLDSNIEEGDFITAKYSTIKYNVGHVKKITKKEFISFLKKLEKINLFPDHFDKDTIVME